MREQISGTNRQRTTKSEPSGSVSSQRWGPLWPAAVKEGFLEEGAFSMSPVHMTHPSWSSALLARTCRKGKGVILLLPRHGGISFCLSYQG